jgi:hypothetical protein
MPRPLVALTLLVTALVLGDRPAWRVHARNTPGVGHEDPVPTPQPGVMLHRAARLRLPGPADSNSPAIWSLVDGVDRFAVMTSIAGAPSLSTGSSLTDLRSPRFTPVAGSTGGVWMEAVVRDPDGTWYGFYHNELVAEVCGATNKMTPRIGAARSEDEGATWVDLGPVIQMPSWTVECETPNVYFTGGVGDFSVILDADSTYLYLFYSQYPAKVRGQGVAIARLAWADRDEPVGRVFVWRDEGWVPARRFVSGEDDPIRWLYPIATPIYPAAESWHDDDETVDAFWGPSVHWNSYLERYVMLLNRARNVEWTNEGIYVAFASSLDQPRAWSTPTRILEGGRWYPQVIGLEPGRGTDKLAGQFARFFMSGESDHIVQFVRQDVGEEPPDR